MTSSLSTPNLLGSYTALSPSASRADVSKVLAAIADAPLHNVDEDTRTGLVRILLDDLAELDKGKSPGRLTTHDVAQALAALKSLGRHPSGARVLSAADTLTFLFELSTAYKDDMDASCEALRCVANTMLLIEDARATVISEEVKGGEKALRLLEKSSAPGLIFLASRILFLATASSMTAGPFIRALVEERAPARHLSVVDVIALRLDSLLISILAGTKMAREAMTDLLKFAYNILAHYPKITDCPKVTDLGAGEGKVMTEYWSDRLDGLLPALLRAFNALPPAPSSPIAAPLSHIIHALIAIPLTPTLLPIWLPSGPSSPISRASSDSPRLGSSSTTTTATTTTATTPGTGTSASTKESRPGALDRALNMLTAGRRSLSSRPTSPNPASSSSSASSSPPPPQPSFPPSSAAAAAGTSDTVQRAQDLLDVALAHYFPGTTDPDDADVRARAKREADATIDELLCPLAILLTKLASADVAARARLREWVVPPNLDRSAPLEGRADALGRLLRVQQSVYHARFKAVTGEMLFAFCNSDSMQLIAAVGYGNVAGFLFNKGIVTAPPGAVPGADGDGGDGAPVINPITGAVQQPAAADELEMTEEEREAEAERLFVLFDRLERSGAIAPSSNPVRRAIAEGRIG